MENTSVPTSRVELGPGIARADQERGGVVRRGKHGNWRSFLGLAAQRSDRGGGSVLN